MPRPTRPVRMWDVVAGEQVKKMTEHDNFVNSCHTLRRGPPLIVSRSDDGTVKVRTGLRILCWGQMLDGLIVWIPSACPDHYHPWSRCLNDIAQQATSQYIVAFFEIGTPGGCLDRSLDTACVLYLEACEGVCVFDRCGMCGRSAVCRR